MTENGKDSGSVGCFGTLILLVVFYWGFFTFLHWAARVERHVRALEAAAGVHTTWTPIPLPWQKAFWGNEGAPRE